MRNDTRPECGSLWSLLLLVIIFGAFILFVPFYRKNDRKAAGAYIGFIIAFAIEMCPVPLNFLGLDILPDRIGIAAHYIFFGCILGGGILIVGGWARISREYWSREEHSGRLVREGLYRHIRHPQYAGFLLMSVGFIFEWTSLLLIALWPVLAIQYTRLAREEEAELEEQFGLQWIEYRSNTGMYFPGVFKKHGG